MLAVFVVALVVGVTYRELTAPGGVAASSPPLPAPTASPIPANFLDSAAIDTDPVVANEFFRDAQIADGTHTYARLATKLDTGCPGLTGVLATALAGQVTPPSAPPVTSTAPRAAASGVPATAAPGGAPSAAPTVPAYSGPICRQLVRALYAGEPTAAGRRIFASVDVLSLDTASRAKLAAVALTNRQGGVPPLPLPAGAVPGAKVNRPDGDNSLQTAFPDGHYVIVIDLAYSDGSAVSSTDGVLADAASNLHSLAVQPLDERLLFGHGYRG
jgi:hypothetical protein